MTSSPLPSFPICPSRTSLLCVQLMDWLFFGRAFKGNACAPPIYGPWPPESQMPSFCHPSYDANRSDMTDTTRTVPLSVWGRNSQRCTKCGFCPPRSLPPKERKTHTRMKHPERRAWQDRINGLAWISSFFFSFLQCTKGRKCRQRVEWQHGGQNDKKEGRQWHILRVGSQTSHQKELSRNK